jgi:hypothetical protein
MPFSVKIYAKGKSNSNIAAKIKKNTVPIGTINGLRRCSMYLIKAEKRKAMPITKQAELTKSFMRPTGSSKFLAIKPRPDGAGWAAQTIAGNNNKMNNLVNNFIVHTQPIFCNQLYFMRLVLYLSPYVKQSSLNAQ